MKIASSIPAASALVESIANGLIQSSEGVTSLEMSSKLIRMSATAAKMNSVTISAPSRNHCVRAESSMPT